MTALDISIPAPAPTADQASRLRDLFRAVQPGTSSNLPEQTSSSTPIIAITSGKGGVGKTNIAVNLATLLAASRRITLVDADLGMANADILCGVSPNRRLQHALPTSDGSVHGRMGTHPCGGVDLAAIGIETPLGFTLVPGSVGVARMADLAGPEQRQLVRGLEALEARSDALILDTGAGISAGVMAFLAAADLVLVVATPEPTSIADAYALIKCLSHRGIAHTPAGGIGWRVHSRISLVVNQCRDIEEAERVHARIAKVASEFLGLFIPFVGWVAKDPLLPEAVMARSPIVRHSPRSPAVAGLREIAAVLEKDWIAQAVRSQSVSEPSEIRHSPLGSLRRLFALRRKAH